MNDPIFKPCPFCGSADHLEMVEPAPLHASNHFAVYCDNCGALGGTDISQRAATESWNMRPTAKPGANE